MSLTYIFSIFYRENGWARWPKGLVGRSSSRLLKKGCAEGLSPFAGCVRVSLTMFSYFFLGGAQEEKKRPAKGRSPSVLPLCNSLNRRLKTLFFALTWSCGDWRQRSPQQVPAAD